MLALFGGAIHRAKPKGCSLPDSEVRVFHAASGTRRRRLAVARPCAACGKQFRPEQNRARRRDSDDAWYCSRPCMHKGFTIRARARAYDVLPTFMDRREGRTIYELADAFKRSVSATREHLKLLEREGLIEQFRNGRYRPWYLTVKGEKHVFESDKRRLRRRRSGFRHGGWCDVRGLRPLLGPRPGGEVVSVAERLEEAQAGDHHRPG